MKERLYEGDVVDLVPHRSVRDDYGIDPYIWQSFTESNPHVIHKVNLDDDGTVCYYELQESSFEIKWCWPPDAFVLHVEPTIVEVGDLL